MSDVFNGAGRKHCYFKASDSSIWINWGKEIVKMINKNGRQITCGIWVDFPQPWWPATITIRFSFTSLINRVWSLLIGNWRQLAFSVKFKAGFGLSWMEVKGPVGTWGTAPISLPVIHLWRSSREPHRIKLKSLVNTIMWLFKFKATYRQTNNTTKPIIRLYKF